MKWKGLPPASFVEDQMLALLREANPVPLSTTEICSHMGTYPFRWAKCGHDDCERSDHLKGYDRPYYGDTVRPILKRLEREGRVERVVLDPRPGRPWSWRYLGDREKG